MTPAQLRAHADLLLAWAEAMPDRRELYTEHAKIWLWMADQLEKDHKL